MEKIQVILLLCALFSAEQAKGQVQPQSCLTDIHSALRDYSAKLSEHSLMIKQLQTLSQVKPVAFSASLRSSGEIVGPSPANTPLVYRHVFTNVGNAYDLNTGVFTAPVKGAYHFEYYIMGSGHISAVLAKNGQNIVGAAEDESNGSGTAANGATLVLEAGDAVSMYLYKNSVVHDNEYHHSTFHGHLMFTV